MNWREPATQGGGDHEDGRGPVARRLAEEQFWPKSSYSNGNGGNCVEVARNLPGIVAVRDSKDPSGPALTFTTAEWQAFVGAVRDGEFGA